MCSYELAGSSPVSRTTETLDLQGFPIFLCAEIPKPYPNDTQSSHVFNEGLHPVCRFAAHGVRHVTVAIQRERCGIMPHVFLQSLDVISRHDAVHREGMPLRYNYDKPEKPRRIKGFEVFSLVFSSFSKPKNHTEISRIVGGVSLTTNE